MRNFSCVSFAKIRDSCFTIAGAASGECFYPTFRGNGIFLMQILETRQDNRNASRRDSIICKCISWLENALCHKVQKKSYEKKIFLMLRIFQDSLKIFSHSISSIIFRMLESG